jgi:phage recombination protein Bet
MHDKDKALVRAEERLPLSRPEDIETLRATIARGATDSEMGLFVQVCQRLRLDPFAKQIYLVKRPGQPASIQASIDGLRVVAERSGDYEGQQAPQWCGADGVWRDVWLAKEAPAAAKVGVYRRGFREPMVRIAKLDAYKQPGPFWTRMPEHMLAKVAEALALRAAFPHDLSGIYAPEEMGEHSAHERHLEELREPERKPERKIERKPEPVVIEVQAEPEHKPEPMPAPAVEVIAKVRSIFPEARVVDAEVERVALDAETELEKAGLTTKTKRGGIVVRFAELGIAQSELADYLGRPCAEMTREDLDELMEIASLIRDGRDSWAARYAAKTATRKSR